MTAAVYLGRTWHARFAPREHRFGQRLYQLLLDVDRTREDLSGHAMIRQGRFGLLSWTPSDHGARDGSSLRAWAEARLAEAGVRSEARRIRLLTMPRVLGFVFNPLSVWFIDDGEDRLEAIIYEVNSTFGQTHAYVAPAAGPGLQRQVAEKRLFVSPFFGIEGEYRFGVAPPSDVLHLTINKVVGDRRVFAAGLEGVRQPLSDAVLLRLFAGLPLMTLGVVAGIHWQAFRLFLKGLRLVPRPPGPDRGTSTAALRARKTRKNDDIVLSDGKEAR